VQLILLNRINFSNLNFLKILFMKIYIFLFSFILTLIPFKNFAQNEKPKLVLQITVDQLRGDFLTRYSDRLCADGFRYFMDNGTWYNNAHHPHSNTETIVGHATLATGAYPAQHGMVANVWLDRSSGNLGYNIEDADYHMLGSNQGVDKKTELDPTQKAAQSDGRSPRAILSTTFSDELFVHYGEKSKVFGVSVKDRGAVSLAGHAGKAFWFSKKSGNFVTSNFYYDDYPKWVLEWNNKRLSDKYKNTAWNLLNDQKSYVWGHADDRPYEAGLPGFGRTFPHSYGDSPKYYYTFLTLSPIGDELTIDFAKTLIDHENIGQDDIPDFLSVSLSSTDYVGHMFGSSSLESEDNILRLDLQISEFIKFIDKKVGLENTIIVLSADHGGQEAPEYMESIGMKVGRLVPSKFDREPFMEKLKAKFGVGEELIQLYYHPYIYLNRELIKEKGIDQAELERAIADELIKIEGIAAAIPSSDLKNNNLPDTELNQQIRRNFHPKRSGDIYLVQEPNWYLYSDESIPLGSMHGSPWRYDTYVPIIFAGGGISAKKVNREVHTTDVAVTLSAILGVKYPSAAAGEPLVEVFEKE
jgi:predicted AlkP superfamily pyrophosphatase or phosphodiesterase